ncbi:MAG: hypothetical protein P8Y48_08160 [Novosphingobium sp.]
MLAFVQEICLFTSIATHRSHQTLVETGMDGLSEKYLSVHLPARLQDVGMVARDSLAQTSLS